LTSVILEFRRHKDTDNPVHIIGFLSQWKLYLDQLPTSSDAAEFRGAKMDPTAFEKVRHSLHRRIIADSLSDVRGTARAVVRADACGKGYMETGGAIAKRGRGGMNFIIRRQYVPVLTCFCITSTDHRSLLYLRLLNELYFPPDPFS
jgi:hypothetical protein